MHYKRELQERELKKIKKIEKAELLKNKGDKISLAELFVLNMLDPEAMTGMMLEDKMRDMASTIVEKTIIEGR